MVKNPFNPAPLPLLSYLVGFGYCYFKKLKKGNMSRQTVKVEYKCTCGKDYGSCGEIGKFFLRYEGVSDTYVISHQPHPDSPLINHGWFDDESLAAFGKLLTDNMDDLSPVTAEESKLVTDNQFTF